MVAASPPTPRRPIIELDQEMVDFITDNCETNIEFALRAMQQCELSKPSLEKLVDLQQKFSRLLKLVREAIKHIDDIVDACDQMETQEKKK